jgi:hypothetical protein
MILFCSFSLFWAFFSTRATSWLNSDARYTIIVFLILAVTVALISRRTECANAGQILRNNQYPCLHTRRYTALCSDTQTENVMQAEGRNGFPKRSCCSQSGRR